MSKKISVVVPDLYNNQKKNLGVSWCYIIGRGLKTMEFEASYIEEKKLKEPESWRDHVRRKVEEIKTLEGGEGYERRL